jgi:hypothetical protein
MIVTDRVRKTTRNPSRSWRRARAPSAGVTCEAGVAAAWAVGLRWRSACAGYSMVVQLLSLFQQRLLDHVVAGGGVGERE